MDEHINGLDRPEPTLSTSDIARYCRTSIVNVNRWITTGLLEAYRYPGGRYKITKENFRNFLKDNNIPIVESFFNDKQSTRILIGEDDSDVAKGLKTALLKHYSDLEIEAIEDGYEILLKMGSVNPDLLILDIELPTLNGLEVCSRIKEQKPFSNIKILAITAHAKRYSREKVIEAGADELLLKPFKTIDLFRNIEKLMGNKLREA